MYLVHFNLKFVKISIKAPPSFLSAEVQERKPALFEPTIVVKNIEVQRKKVLVIWKLKF